MKPTSEIIVTGYSNFPGLSFISVLSKDEHFKRVQSFFDLIQRTPAAAAAVQEALQAGTIQVRFQPGAVLPAPSLWTRELRTIDLRDDLVDPKFLATCFIFEMCNAKNKSFERVFSSEQQLTADEYATQVVAAEHETDVAAKEIMLKIAETEGLPDIDKKHYSDVPSLETALAQSKLSGGSLYHGYSHYDFYKAQYHQNKLSFLEGERKRLMDYSIPTLNIALALGADLDEFMQDRLKRAQERVQFSKETLTAAEDSTPTMLDRINLLKEQMKEQESLLQKTEEELKYWMTLNAHRDQSIKELQHLQKKAQNEMIKRRQGAEIAKNADPAKVAILYELIEIASLKDKEIEGYRAHIIQKKGETYFKEMKKKYIAAADDRAKLFLKGDLEGVINKYDLIFKLQNEIIENFKAVTEGREEHIERERDLEKTASPVLTAYSISRSASDAQSIKQPAPSKPTEPLERPESPKPTRDRL